MDAYIGFYILRFRNKGKSVHSTALQKDLLNDSTEHGQAPPSECLGIMCKLQSRGKRWQLQPGRQESLRRGSGDAPSPRAAVQQGGCNTLTFGCLPRAPGTGQGGFIFQGPGATREPAQHQPVVCSCNLLLSIRQKLRVKNPLMFL